MVIKALTAQSPQVGPFLPDILMRARRLGVTSLWVEVMVRSRFDALVGEAYE